MVQMEAKHQLRSQKSDLLTYEDDVHCAHIKSIIVR
jgi:hypothetical protein